MDELAAGHFLKERPRSPARTDNNDAFVIFQRKSDFRRGARTFDAAGDDGIARKTDDVVPGILKVRHDSDVDFRSDIRGLRWKYTNRQAAWHFLCAFADSLHHTFVTASTEDSPSLLGDPLSQLQRHIHGRTIVAARPHNSDDGFSHAED